MVGGGWVMLESEFSMVLFLFLFLSCALGLLPSDVLVGWSS